MELIVGTYGQRMRLLELTQASFEVLSSTDFEAENTSALALSPDGRFLFAVSESGERSGVYSFEILPSRNPATLSAGRIVKRSEIRDVSPDPCHLLYLPGYFNQCGDPDNGALLTADYSGGSVSVYPVLRGRIQPPVQVVHFEGHGTVPLRQEAPHIHHLAQHGNLLLAVDLGADCIHVLRLFDSVVRPLCDTRLRREPRLERLFDIPAPSGSGPRHLVFDPSGTHFYVLTELSNELLVYSCPDFATADDRPVLLQRLLAGDRSYPTQAGGDLQLSPDGRHLYASMRNGGDGLVICDILPDGSLRRCGFQSTGAHVRDFMFLPDKPVLLACCKNGRCVQLYRYHPEDGSLSLLQEIPFDGPYFGEPVFGLPLR